MRYIIIQDTDIVAVNRGKKKMNPAILFIETTPACCMKLIFTLVH